MGNLRGHFSIIKKPIAMNKITEKYSPDLHDLQINFPFSTTYDGA
jgi:hypothetical protein